MTENATGVDDPVGSQRSEHHACYSHSVEFDPYFIPEYRRQCPNVHWTEVSSGGSGDAGQGEGASSRSPLP